MGYCDVGGWIFFYPSNGAMEPDVARHEYYGCEPSEREGPPERYPANHVRFSALLRPLEWVYRGGEAVGARPLSMAADSLREFDRAGPHDEVLGSRQELDRIRALLEFGCAGLDGNPYLSPVGRFLLKKIGVGFLRVRREVLEHYHAHRERIEAHGKVRAPIIITGLPRSGTTLLHRLLSEDPSTRSPYTFEMEMPLPPLRAGVDPLTDPRIEKSGSAYVLMTRVAPGLVEKLNESHLWSATEMEECFLYMLAHNGIFVMNAFNAGSRYTKRFLAHEDKRPVFRYERLFLTTLDAYRPAKSHWTLKAPNYAPCFPLLFDEYPDARVIVTHRNPLMTLPSLCRLMESWCIAFDRDGTFDKYRFGQLARTLVERCLMVPLAHRAAHPDHESQIFDCMYEELFADPIAMIRRVYRRFDLEFTDTFERRMVTYLENNKQGKYGRHKYSLQEYGFDAAAVFDQFRVYMERYGFDIPVRIERPLAIGP